MAGSSFFLLFDDIATLLDDVSVMTKVAVRKTAGVLGDDLALNAQQVSGVIADRELPVVWAVAKGSAVNKAILVPAALAISFFIPWAVQPLLMIGGVYLCFEGVEKLLHQWLADHHQHHDELAKAAGDEKVDMVEFERNKIRGAVRTDFILSAEIIVIALGTISEAEIVRQILVLVAIAVVMTVGVYGAVAAIVKLDDLGLYLTRPERGNLAKRLGMLIVAIAPGLMRLLSVVGLIAMFLVGGGIVAHGIGPLHHFAEHAAEAVHDLPLGSVWAVLAPMLINGLTGVVAGAIAVGVVTGIQKARRKFSAKPEQTSD